MCECVPPYLLILGGEHVVVEDGGLLVEPVDVVPHGLTHLGGLPLPLLLIQHPYTHRDRQADRRTDRQTGRQADFTYLVISSLSFCVDWLHWLSLTTSAKYKTDSVTQKQISVCLHQR